MDTQDSTTAALEHALETDADSKHALRQRFAEKESELNTILKGSPNIIMSLDRHANILHINHLTTNFEIYDMEGTNACVEIFVNSDEIVHSALQHAFEDQEVTQTETTTIIGECITRFTPVIYQGEVQKVMAISLDISPLKQKEREVQLILKHSPTIITTIDLDGRILEFNHLTPSFELYDMEGEDVYENLFCGGTTKIKNTVRKVIDKQELLQVETNTIVGDCISRFTPVINGGIVTKIMIISMDISDVKKAEKDLRCLNSELIDAKQKLEELNEQLEDKVLQRTQELEELSQKMLASNITINRKNLIINSLFETCTRIHHSADLDKILNFTLKQLKVLFSEMNFTVFITGGRGEIIESIAFTGISEKIQHFIVQNHLDFLDDLKTREIYEHLSVLNDDPTMPIIIDGLVMQGRDKKEMGKLLIFGSKLDITTKKILSVFLEQVSAASENIILSRKLTKMAFVDGLTGAYNRAYFDSQLTRMQNQYQHSKIIFSVLLIDINGLKRINDEFGHYFGDLLIQEAAKLLKKCCRDSDVIARIGGDEFAVLCSSIDIDQITTVMDRIHEQEQYTSIMCKNGNIVETVPIRLSVGSACATQDPLEEIMDIADARMYEEKKAFYEKSERYR